MKAARGKASDCFWAVSRAGMPTAFAKKFHMGQSHSFAFKTHGEAACEKMTNEAVRRLEFWYDMYLGFESDADFMVAAKMVECPEDLDFVEWLLEEDVGSKTWDRAHQVMSLKPTL